MSDAEFLNDLMNELKKLRAEVAKLGTRLDQVEKWIDERDRERSEVEPDEPR